MGAAEYERFSDAAHRAVVLAEREARTTGHEIAGPEHLLLTLMETNIDVQARLEAVGVNQVRLRDRMAEWQPAANAVAPVERAVFAPTLRRAVQLSGRLATQERSHTVTGLHLLHALVEVEDEFLLRLLIGLGVDPADLRFRPRRRAPAVP